MDKRIKAIILCGGEGKRMRPLSAVTPKALLKINGVELITGLICFLGDYGIKDVGVTVGYKSEKIKQTLGEELCGVKLTYFTEDEPLGSAGGVKRAANFITGDDLIVMCADAYCNFDLSEALEYFRSESPDALILTTKRELSPLEYGIVVGKGANRGEVEGFVEKPSWSGVCTDRINTGIYFLKKSVLDLIPEGRSDFGFDLFGKLLKENKRVLYFDISGEWRDIGNPRQLYDCNMDHTGGENYIDEGCSIPQNALVERSVLYSGVLVGEGCQIYGAILGEGCIIGEGVRIRQGAVIGPYAVIGDGATIGEGVVIGEGKVVKSKERIISHLYRRDLFTSSGILLDFLSGGEVFSLGYVLGSCFGQDHKIAVMYEGQSVSAAAVNSFMSGLCHGAKEVFDLGVGFSSLGAFCGAYGEYDLVIFIKKSGAGLFFEFYDKDGLYPGARFESLVRSSVSAFSQPPEKQTDKAPILRSGNREKYKQSLIKAVGTSLEGIGFSIHCDGTFGQVISECISELGGVATPYGADVIIGAETCDGKSIDVIYKGCFLDFDHIRALCIDAYSKQGLKEISLPYRESEALKSRALKNGMRLSLYAENYYDKKENAIRSGVKAAPALVDGGAALATFLGYVVKNNLYPSDITRSLPVFYTRYKSVSVPVMKKRRIVVGAQNFDKEGFLITTAQGRVRVIAENGDCMSLCAEAGSMEDARDMIRCAEEYIKNFDKPDE